MFSFAQGIAPIYPIWERDAQGNIMTNPTTGENLLDWGDGDVKDRTIQVQTRIIR